MKEKHEKLTKAIESQKGPAIHYERELKRFNDTWTELLDAARRGNENAQRIIPDWNETPRDPNDHRIRI